MCKRLLVLTAALLLMGTTAFGDAVGIFDNAADIGGPAGIGSTVAYDYVTTNGLDTLTQRYLVTGGGADIWGNSDQFQFAYKELTGDVRVSAEFDWHLKNNGWAKYGVMIRDLEAGASAVTYQQLSRNAEDGVFFQARQSEGGGSGSFNDNWTAGFTALGIQRVTMGDYTLMEGLVDYGSGWESQGIAVPWNLPDAVGAGIAVTSHDNGRLAQAFAYNVQYDDAPELVASLLTVPADAAIDQCSDIPGFNIHVAQPLVSDGWGWAAAAELLETGAYMGLPAVPGTDVTAMVPVVNFRDTANGAFDNDMSFPGIDPFEQPAGDPAAGDDDNNFGAEVSACIYLTAGAHIIGANSDDGTIITIGGVEVLRTEEWKGASNRDAVFVVEADGYYDLHALWIEGGGGGNLELHEVLADGTRILLGDVAAGGSPVFVPEPATIALLGLGGLALIRRRKGA